MANKIIVGLIALLAIVQGLAGDAVPEGIVPLLIVLLGLVYGWMSVDADDATGFLVLALAVGAASGADVLGHIQVIGGPLDAIVDQVGTALYAGVMSVLGKGLLNILKG
jgi:hypothetical protein